MTDERRAEITGRIFSVFAQRSSLGKPHPVPYGKMVLDVQYYSDITREEIDHVLMALNCRRMLNAIGGDLFFCGNGDLLRPEGVPIDSERIDWVYGSGRYATQ